MFHSIAFHNYCTAEPHFLLLKKAFFFLIFCHKEGEMSNIYQKRPLAADMDGRKRNIAASS